MSDLRDTEGRLTLKHQVLFKLICVFLILGLLKRRESLVTGQDRINGRFQLIERIRQQRYEVVRQLDSRRRSGTSRGRDDFCEQG